VTGSELTYSERSAVKRRARSVAENVLENFWDDDSFPVDPFKISSELGTDVFQADLPEDVSGLARRVGTEKSAIYVERSDAMNRQRFTCAHELGHLVDDEESDVEQIDRRRDTLSTQGVDKHEIFANEFAANLLMPQVAVRALRRRGMGINAMASFFGVSAVAMGHRLENLGLS
jgi:Zn-dependent peptidase ImmA (M78 family)